MLLAWGPQLESYTPVLNDLLSGLGAHLVEELSCSLIFSSGEKATAHLLGVTPVFLKGKDWDPCEQAQSYREALVVMCSIICLSVCLST